MHAAPVTATLSLTAILVAGGAVADADAAGQAFADHCFNPHLTAQTAQATLAPSGARIDFYDLRPFSSAAPSPVRDAPRTPGTDRRCEVAFDGSHPQIATDWLTRGLTQEGLAQKTAPVPANFKAQDGTRFIAAAQLNPNRIAVVQTGVRSGPNGPETFLNVERLIPLDEADQ